MTHIYTVAFIPMDSGNDYRVRAPMGGVYAAGSDDPGDIRLYGTRASAQKVADRLNGRSVGGPAYALNA